MSDALLRLRDGADEAQMLAAAGPDANAGPLLFHYLDQLRQAGLLVADLWSENRLVATPLSRSKDFDPVVQAAQRGPWQLSRFAYLRRDGNDLILECPEAPCAVVVKSPELVAWIHKAAEPSSAAAGTPESLIMSLLQQLAFLIDPGQEESWGQQTREFHDRLFHRHASWFDDFRHFGGTYRFCERFRPAPAIRPVYPGETIPLLAPDSRNSRSLGDIMEARRSNGEMGDRPVSRDQVAELLYRVGRVCETVSSPLQTLLRRPYPSGGSIHELEFYLAVRACDGLEPGYYHYRGAEPSAAAMLANCARSWAQPDRPPQCLIVLASR